MVALLWTRKSILQVVVFIPNNEALNWRVRQILADSDNAQKFRKSKKVFQILGFVSLVLRYN